MKKINKNRNVIIGVILYIIFLIIINISYFTQIIHDPYNGPKSKLLYIIVSIILSIISAYLIILVNKKKKMKLENIFVILALIVGLFYMSATPLLKGHDEAAHWYKAYSVSMGDFFQVKNEEGKMGNYLPSKVQGIYDIQGDYKAINYGTSMEAWNYAQDKTISNDMRFTNNEATAAYPPIQMLPQAVGIFIGRTLGLNMFLQAMCGRFTNLLFFVLVGYFTIKFIPNRKAFLLILLLSPKIIYTSTTLSGDVFTNMITLLFTSYIFKLKFENKKISKKDMIFLMILTPCISICKLVYFAMCALVLILPKERFKNKKSKYIFVIMIFLISAISILLWTNVINQVNRAVNSEMQKEWILLHPISYLGVIARGIFNNFSAWILDMVGGTMSWHVAVRQPQIISDIILFLLLVSVIQEDDNNEKNNLFDIIVILAISIIVIVMINTALYLEWSSTAEVGGINITGIQGRYFIPITLMLASIIPNKFIKLKNKINIECLCILIILCQIPSILNLLTNYI